MHRHGQTRYVGDHHAKPWQRERLWWGVIKGGILGAVVGAITGSVATLISVLLRGIHFFSRRWGVLTHDEALALWGRFIMYAIGPGAILGVVCALVSFAYWRRWHKHHRRRVWGFIVPPEGEVLASKAVAAGTAMALWAYHHEDGRWEFLHREREQFLRDGVDESCRVAMEKIVHQVPDLPVVGALRLGCHMRWDAVREEWCEGQATFPGQAADAASLSPADVPPANA